MVMSLWPRFLAHPVYHIATLSYYRLFLFKIFSFFFLFWVKNVEADFGRTLATFLLDDLDDVLADMHTWSPLAADVCCVAKYALK